MPHTTLRYIWTVCFREKYIQVSASSSAMSAHHWLTYSFITPKNAETALMHVLAWIVVSRIYRDMLLDSKCKATKFLPQCSPKTEELIPIMSPWPQRLAEHDSSRKYAYRNNCEMAIFGAFRNDKNFIFSSVGKVSSTREASFILSEWPFAAWLQRFLGVCIERWNNIAWVHT